MFFKCNLINMPLYRVYAFVQASGSFSIIGLMNWLAKRLITGLYLSFWLAASLTAPASAQDGGSITPADLIGLVNDIRTGNGLPALEVNSILMGTAQSTAETMAASLMGWHIGNVSGRVMAAGYGGGATAWATENFAIGPMSLQDLAWVWSDASHMIPMVNPAYQHIGAGVATAPDGSVYYIVQAAYTSASPATRTQVPGTVEAFDPTAPPAQWIIPVVTATPDADGKVIHEVQMGQSLWSIAIAYNTHIVDILRFNQMSPEQQVVWIGQKLAIPVTPQPATATAIVESTATLPVVRSTATLPVNRQASNVKPAARPTTRATLLPLATATATAAVFITPVPTSANHNNSPAIIYLIAGVFITGVGLTLYGLWSKRA